VTDFTTFLVRSLQLLRVCAPTGYAAICDKLGGRCVSIEVDAERVQVHSESGVLDVKWGNHSAVASARASRATLRSLLRGERSLNAAILADDVILIGATGDLVAFYEALVAYFMSAVCTPNFSLLLDEFLRGPPLQDVRPPPATHVDEHPRSAEVKL
jgi:hypothetical protein